MFSIVGILVVFGSVVAGYLMEKGKLAVLMQPAELVVIGGAAIGTVLVANPIHILKKMIAGVIGVLKGSPFSKKRYVDTLKMMFELFAKSRKEGAIAIESDVEEPEKSPTFSKYPDFLKDHHVRDFVCDTMRMAITGGVGAFDLDQVMQRLENINEVGRGIAVAFVATLYGVGIANIVLLPCAGRIKILMHRNQVLREMILEGVLAILDNRNPKALEAKLSVYLSGAIPRRESKLVAQ